ncbi:MAG: hypothetical protein ACM3PP_08630 [Candidatus Saccharibacteria bacterium]
MLLREGKNNGINFEADYLSGVTIKFDGQEQLEMHFASEEKKDWCEVTLDWVEEIKSFRELLRRICVEGERDVKIYPDDFRGLMMRCINKENEMELQYIKNFQAVRVVMTREHGDMFWETVQNSLQNNGKNTIKY